MPGSKVADTGSTSVYAKPLSGADPPASFAAVLLHRGATTDAPREVTMRFNHDFYPFGPSSGRAHVRDVHAYSRILRETCLFDAACSHGRSHSSHAHRSRVQVLAGTDLGIFDYSITLNVSSHDAALLVVSFDT
jgi:hypothetical protein